MLGLSLFIALIAVIIVAIITFRILNSERNAIGIIKSLILSINVFILDNICIVITQLTKGRKKKFWVFVARISLKTLSFGN